MASRTHAFRRHWLLWISLIGTGSLAMGYWIGLLPPIATYGSRRARHSDFPESLLDYLLVIPWFFVAGYGALYLVMRGAIGLFEALEWLLTRSLRRLRVRASRR